MKFTRTMLYYEVRVLWETSFSSMSEEATQDLSVLTAEQATCDQDNHFRYRQVHNKSLAYTIKLSSFFISQVYCHLLFRSTKSSSVVFSIADTDNVTPTVQFNGFYKTLLKKHTFADEHLLPFSSLKFICAIFFCWKTSDFTINDQLSWLLGR